MSSVNKAIIVGNLGNEPDSRFLPSGEAVTNISVATSETWKDKTTGEKKEKTEWHRVAFFGRVAEVAAQYLHKGSKVYVEGPIETRKWTDKAGVDRYTTEIKGRVMKMLSTKPHGETGQSSSPNRPHGNEQSDEPQPDGEIEHVKAEDFDDDIPF